MKQFMDKNFMLETETAVELYNKFAAGMPIFDYHCHLSPKEIYENKPYENITQVWLYGDHYKWRAMRANGIDEKYITGDGSDYEKFMAWAKTLPYTIGNPIYHWTHLELQRFFDIYEPLNEKTADEIWNKVNAKLTSGDFKPCDFIEKSNVKALCTTDDPCDNLEYHKKIAEEEIVSAKVLPTFRPDKAIEINRCDFADYITALSETAGEKIDCLDTLLKVLADRVEYFHSVGCRISDHGIENIPFVPADKSEIDSIFKTALTGNSVSKEAEDKYKTYLLLFCAREYAKHGWAMQLHINAIRNNNSIMFEKLGADKGYDSIHDLTNAKSLSGMFDTLEKDGLLPKTILYSLNPNDNYVLATMAGNFQSSSVAGKMQLGSAWWFNDNRDGMVEQMKNLANVGLLSRFVGMLTDSRSFLSYPRHEYFRRIMCNIIGEWVEKGEYPLDWDMLEKIVKGICFNNAKDYFGIDL